MVLLTIRGIDVDDIVPPSFDCADHLSSTPAAFYSYLVFLVFQPRNFFLTVRAIPGVNRPILQHRRTPLLLFLRKRYENLHFILLIKRHTSCRISYAAIPHRRTHIPSIRLFLLSQETCLPCHSGGTPHLLRSNKTSPISLFFREP